MPDLGEQFVQRNDITDDLAKLAFDFFYSFSRFEFALKECGYLKSKKPGAKAKPNWGEFVEKWEDRYAISEAGRALLEENPATQVIAACGDLDFVAVDFAEGNSDLQQVVDLVNIVRNNLFHGGKHGGKGWDDPKRMMTLLPIVITLLGELAEFSEIDGDYLGIY